jgi:hypothetical protein
MKLEPKIMINWLLVESALMPTSPNILGPINVPNSSNPPYREPLPDEL